MSLLAFRVKCPWHVYSPQMLLSPLVHPFPPSPNSLNQTQAHYIFRSYTVLDPRGGGAKGHESPPEAVRTIKKPPKNTPWLLLKQMWTLGLGWAHTGLRVWPGLANDGILKSPVVESGRKKHCCFSSQSQTKLGNLGWVHLSPVPRLWHVCSLPPSSIPLLLPLQIPCSLVAKLISNSCAPPSPTRLREMQKRAPVPSLLPCWVYVIWLGWMKRTQYSGTYAHFFFRCRLGCFFRAFFLQILSPPPHPPSRSQGLCCFSKHWADSYLMTRKCKTNS